MGSEWRYASVALMVGCIVGIVLVLVGCAPREAPPVRPYDNVFTPTIQYDTHDTWINEFRLKDGTRCVYVRAGGVTCDWEGPRELVER
jgi:hypothetical protein